MTGLGLSEQDKAERDSLRGLELQEAQWKKCERWKSDLMRNSPVVTFMLKHLALVGANVTSEHLHCLPCDATRAGGFSPDAGILLCQDRFNSKGHMEDTLTHELIHMYDHARFEVDWSNLRHHACSEIRAASLSGDCRWLRETTRGFMGFTKQHQACVRRRAILSVLGNPACYPNDRQLETSSQSAPQLAGTSFPNPQLPISESNAHLISGSITLPDYSNASTTPASDARRVRERDILARQIAEKAVNEVWESCFADTRPFDEIY